MMNKRKMKKLDTVAQLISGRTPDRDRKEYYAEKGTPWVKIENLDQGVITRTTEYLSEQGREKVNLVPEQSVLFSIVGTVGKVGIAGCELAMNQQIVALVFDETQVLPLYGYYCLRHYAGEIRSLADQTTMALISRKTLGQYRIPVPDSLEEQQEIIDQLSRLERYESGKRLWKEQLEDLEAQIFERWFGRELQENECLPLSAWLSAPVTMGIPKAEDPENGFPCVRNSEFQERYLVEETLNMWKNTKTAPPVVDKRYQIQKGDLLLRNGQLLLPDAEGEVFFDRSVAALRTDAAQLLPEVLYGCLRRPEFQERLYGVRKAGDSRKRAIRLGDLEKMHIPWFSMKKQEHYQEIIRKIREISRGLDAEIKASRQAFAELAGLLLEEWHRNEAPKEMEETVEIPDLPKEETVELPEAAAWEKKAAEAPVVLENVREQQNVISHLVLAVLCGWCPGDEKTGAYGEARNAIFHKAIPVFQPAALSFVKADGQEEYLLERDFLTYRSGVLCEKWENPLAGVRELLQKKRSGEILDAHLVFPGEHGLCTEADWSDEVKQEMAREGLSLLLLYSGLEDCQFLLHAR